jgi:hypothetical protein
VAQLLEIETRFPNISMGSLLVVNGRLRCLSTVSARQDFQGDVAGLPVLARLRHAAMSVVWSLSGEERKPFDELLGCKLCF